MSTNPSESIQDNIMKTGVISPYALVELKLNKKVNWKQIQNPRELFERTLNMPYESYLILKYGGPLYPDLDREPTTAETQRIELPAGIIIDDAWKDPGEFFHEAAELTDPVQGGVGDCYFIGSS